MESNRSVLLYNEVHITSWNLTGITTEHRQIKWSKCEEKHSNRKVQTAKIRRAKWQEKFYGVNFLPDSRGCWICSSLFYVNYSCHKMVETSEYDRRLLTDRIKRHDGVWVGAILRTSWGFVQFRGSRSVTLQAVTSVPVDDVPSWRVTRGYPFVRQHKW